VAPDDRVIEGSSSSQLAQLHAAAMAEGTSKSYALWTIPELKDELRII